MKYKAIHNVSRKCQSYPGKVKADQLFMVCEVVAAGGGGGGCRTPAHK